MDEWNWFSVPIKATYYYERSAQDIVTREAFYLGFRYFQGNVIYLTERGVQIGRSDTLRHKRIEA